MHWWVRKLYNMPPTDPRYLAMTEEQMALEYEHYLLDHPELAEKEAYTDPNYEAWEAEVMAEEAANSPVSTTDEWEEVELDLDPIGEGG